MGNFPIYHRIAAQGFDLILIFLIDFHFLKFLLCYFNGIAFQKNVKDRTFLTFDNPLHRAENAIYYYTITRCHSAG